jgi:hypothetical protein
MSAPQVRKENVGRIAERIVANELEARGFQVRDLNLEGIAANVDLLAVKNGKAWQIQVKGSTYDQNYEEHGWWFQYGYCTEAHIQNPSAVFFNRSGGTFQAEIVVFVCIKTPRNYKCIVLPVEVAEEAAQLNLGLFRMKKADGSEHKPGKAWFSLYSTKARTEERQALLNRELNLIMPFEERWDFDERNPAEAAEANSTTIAHH